MGGWMDVLKDDTEFIILVEGGVWALYMGEGC